MYKLVLCYDGTEYHGWQRQSNGITVQEKVEDVLELLSGKKTVVHGCSRTDAGVHAREFVCSFEGNLSIPCDKIPYAMNAHLPDDISIVSCSDKNIKIGLWGGVFQHNPSYRNRFVSFLSADSYDNVELIKFTPELGAITACFRSEGIELTENLKNTILEEYNI